VLALIFLVWMIGFIARALRASLKQREFPEEAQLTPGLSASARNTESWQGFLPEAK
jgi:hypothetical protein